MWHFGEIFKSSKSVRDEFGGLVVTVFRTEGGKRRTHREGVELKSFVIMHHKETQSQTIHLYITSVHLLLTPAFWFQSLSLQNLQFCADAHIRKLGLMV